MLEVLDEVEMQLENEKKDRGAKGHLILTSATFWSCTLDCMANYRANKACRDRGISLRHCVEGCTYRVHTAVHRTNCRASSRTSIWGSSDARYRSAYGRRNIELRAIIRNFHVASKIFLREHSCTRENPKGKIQEQGDWDIGRPTFSCEARQTSRTWDVHWSRLAPPLLQDLVWSKIWRMNEFSCDTECPHQLYLW